MIYFLSDLHGDFSEIDPLKEYLERATEHDLLIMLGDVGMHFRETDDNKEFTQFFLSMDKPVAILDGNHENFDYLNGLPTEIWNGGTVHRLTDHIVHLMRGQIYTLEGKTFFTFGGCKSSEKWIKNGPWYPAEEATDAEYETAYANLRAHNHTVDYILTHKYRIDDPNADLLSLDGLTKYIDTNVTFRQWYCGHWHKVQRFDDRHLCLYDELISMTETEQL